MLEPDNSYMEIQMFFVVASWNDDLHVIYILIGAGGRQSLDCREDLDGFILISTGQGLRLCYAT